MLHYNVLFFKASIFHINPKGTVFISSFPEGEAVKTILSIVRHFFGVVRILL